MTVELVDLVKMYISRAETSYFELGTPVEGFRGQDALTNGAQYSYSIQIGSNYEVGSGFYDVSTGQLTRAILYSSYGNGPIPIPTDSVITFTALARDFLSRSDAEIERIEATAASALSSISAAGTTQIGLVNDEGDDQVNLVHSAGTGVLTNISAAEDGVLEAIAEQQVLTINAVTAAGVDAAADALDAAASLEAALTDAPIRNAVAVQPLPGTLLVASATIDSEGWRLTVVIPGNYSAATFDATKIYVHSVTTGYEEDLTATKREKIARGTAVVRKPYPNQSSFQVSYAAGNTTAVFALDNFVNADEENNGPGSSEWDPWVFFEAGWMTVSGVPAAREGRTVANGSTKPVGVTLGANMSAFIRELSDTETFEIIADAEGARNGRTIAAARLTLTGVTSAHVVQAVVTAMTVSSWCSSPTGGFPAMVYAAADVDCSGFTAGEHVTEKWEIYPWIGAMLSSDSAPYTRFATRTHIKATGNPKVYCEFNSGAGSAGGTPNTTEGSVIAGNSLYQVLQGAANATVSGKFTDVVLVLDAGEHNLVLAGSNLQTYLASKMDIYGPLVRPKTGVAKEDCKVNNNNSQNIFPSGGHFQGITFKPNSSARACIQFNLTSSTTGTGWAENCDVSGPGTEITNGVVLAGAAVFVGGGTWTRPGSNGHGLHVMRNLLSYTDSGDTSGAANGIRKIGGAARLYSVVASSNPSGRFRWNYGLFNSGNGAATEVIQTQENCTGASFLNVLMVRTAGTGPMVGMWRESNTSAIRDLYWRHVAYNGARGNFLYDDDSANVWATGALKTAFFNQYSIHFEFNNKDDAFASDAENVHNWAIGYHVGFRNNFYLRSFTNKAGPDYDAWFGEVRQSSEKRGLIANNTDALPDPWTNAASNDYRPVDDATFAARTATIALAAGTGGSEVDWSANPTRAMVPVDKAVCGFDIAGNARPNDGTDCCGPYAWGATAVTV